MDRLWTPWRYAYVNKSEHASGCIFCEKATQTADEDNFIVWRSKHSFVLLNIYPYNNGHIMVAPYEHADTLSSVSEETATELIHLGRRAEKVLRHVYHPKGLNLGMNIGECAGAGVAGHIHLHVLPRWPGDVSFMTSVGETRVVPEDLHTTWEKITRAFHEIE